MVDKTKEEPKRATFKEMISVSWKTFVLVWNIDKWLLLGNAIAVIIPGILPFINLYIYKLVLDIVAEVIAGATFDPTRFYPLIGFRILTYFLTDVSFKTQALLDRILWGKVPMHVSQMVFQKVHKLDLQYFEDPKFRDLLEKARETYNHRPQDLISNFLYGLQSLIQVILAFVAIAQLNWILVILVSIIAIPEFINETHMSKLGWGIWSENTTLRKRYGYLQHILLGFREIKEVRLFKLANRFIKEVKDLQQKMFDDSVVLAKKNYFYNLLFNMLSTAVYIGVEVYVIFEALSKRLTIGDIGFYTGVVSNFQNGLGGVFHNVNRIFETSLYIKSLFELFELKPLIPHSPNPIKLGLKVAPKIEFRNVSFTYPGSKQKILSDFSLIIESGEKVAFVGENGAGKSTIIKLLARLYDVDKGEIYINDISIKALNIEEWYDYLGVLFQDYNRYDHKVRENIEFGRSVEGVTLQKIIHASISAGAHPMVQKLDKGYEQMLGRTFDEGIELSGGQWQKVALARAFFRNAQVLVLDEPTSAIDAKAEAEIFEKVEKLSKDKTVIIISHRFSTVRNADKIFVIDKGKIKESGSHQELMEIDGQYAAMFKLQARGYQ